MSLIFKVYQRPEVTVASKYYVSSSSAVASVGASERHKFFSPEMRAPRPSVARAAKYFDVIYEIRS
jgi:hypothetical protein